MPGEGTTVTGGVWRRRRVLGLLLHATVVVVPLLVGCLIAFTATMVVSRPDGIARTVLWWMGVATASFLALTLSERLLRRLLPLAALLRLSLVFPDRAPSRFAVARRAGRPAELRRRLDTLRAAGRGDSPEARDATLTLSLIVDLAAHDKRTRGHAERTRVFADMIAESLGLNAADRARLRWAAILHDIGKLHVPAAVLNKPAALDPEERVIVDRHPAAGGEMVQPLRPWLGVWAGAVAEHHEHYDGNGYPRRLRGDSISLAGRIVAVADAFETMTAVRAYRQPLSVTAARRELVRASGTHFDPRIVRAFLEVSLGRLLLGVGPLAALAALPFAGRAATSVARAPSLLRPVAGAAAVSLATVLVVPISSQGSPVLAGAAPDRVAVMAPPPAPLAPLPLRPSSTGPGIAPGSSGGSAAGAVLAASTGVPSTTAASSPAPPPPPPATAHHRITVIVTVHADPAGPGASGSVFISGPNGTPTVQKTVP